MMNDIRLAYLEDGESTDAWLASVQENERRIHTVEMNPSYWIGPRSTSIDLIIDDICETFFKRSALRDENTPIFKISFQDKDGQVKIVEMIGEPSVTIDWNVIEITEENREEFE